MKEAEPLAPSFKLKFLPDNEELDLISKIVLVEPNPTLQSEREQNKY